jgi:DNA-binding NarL/FixJ family response regulator
VEVLSQMLSSSGYQAEKAFDGFDSTENRDQIIKAGADGYMAKPVEKDGLIQNIENILNN